MIVFSIYRWCVCERERDIYPTRSPEIACVAGAYWTGYYTSRPALKQYVRSSGAVLRRAETLLSIAQGWGATGSMRDAALSQLQVMRQAQGVTQHHDAVSGTEQQHVADDYRVQLNQGTVAADAVSTSILRQILTATGPGAQAPVLSLDPAAVASLTVGQFLPVVVYNSLAWDRQDVVNVSLNRADVIVLNGSNVRVTSQINPNANFTLDAAASKYTLFFQADVPALGFAVFFLTVNPSLAVLGRVAPAVLLPPQGPRAPLPSLATAQYNVSFGADGRLAAVTNLQSGIGATVAHDFWQYTSASQSGQNSGAYVFRPEQDNVVGIGSNSA